MSVPNLPQAGFKSIYASVNVVVTDNGLEYFCPNNIDTENATWDPATNHAYLPFRQAVNLGILTASVQPFSTSTGGAPADPTAYFVANVNYRLNSDDKGVGVDLWWFTTTTGGDTSDAAPNGWHLTLHDVGNVRDF